MSMTRIRFLAIMTYMHDAYPNASWDTTVLERYWSALASFGESETMRAITQMIRSSPVIEPPEVIRDRILANRVPEGA